MKTEYLRPTLFGIAYATRLFREIDSPSSFDILMQDIKPQLNLQNRGHAKAMLTWLNKWGCRIAEDEFDVLSSMLARWFQDYEGELPSADIDICKLGIEGGIERLVHAYEMLRIPGLGPTSKAKVLFAIRPNSAIPWDEPIREAFNLADDGSAYGEMLMRSCQEAKELEEDARRYEVTDIPAAVERPGYSLAKLLDEYHWVTISEGHRIPRHHDLERWISWCPRGDQP